MTTELYKIEYVELTPAQAEESDDLEFLEVVAEVDGDPFEAINFWAIDMEWTLVNYDQVHEGIAKLYMSPSHYIAL